MNHKMEHKGTKTIDTERLFLRQFQITDVHDCMKNWASDPEVYRYISRKPMAEEEIVEWLSPAEEVYSDLKIYYWAIVEKESNEVIGAIYVDDLSEKNKWCELDWMIGKSYWNQGMTSEAGRAVLNYLLKEIGFHRVQAKCCVENRASERIMQKLGMKREGILREYFFNKEDRFLDVVMYAIVNEEYL